MNPTVRSAALTTIRVAILAGIGAGGGCTRDTQLSPGPGKGFVHGNGRIEASEMEVATRQLGRVQHIFVQEGDFVVAGQRLAQMQVDIDQAERDEVAARRRQAIETVVSAGAEVAVRELECQAADAAAQGRKTELDAAQGRLARTESLTLQGALAQRDVDNERAAIRQAEAALAASELHHDAACAAVLVARMHVTSARSAVSAAEAARRPHTAFLEFDVLAPRDGRVQERLAQPGEVLEAGGKVLKMVALADVSMNLLLPEATGRRVALGSDVRIVLDGVRQLVIPATVSTLASVVEVPPEAPATTTGRQNRMLRVKAEIDRELLRRHLQLLNTTRSGIAWIRIDPRAEWPAGLSVSPELIVTPRS